MLSFRHGFIAAGIVTACATLAAPAGGQTFTSGSTGADGAFSPSSTTTVTLSASGIFHFTTINVPAGVTVKFTRNATNTPVTLLATGAVTIAGTIDVSGTQGGDGTYTTQLGNNAGIGGPGGFSGGAGANGVVATTGGAGLGPGGGGPAGAGGGWESGSGGGGGFLATGGNATAGDAGAGGAAYGTAALLPLIGGSGGGGGGRTFGGTGGGGGGGGGALLIASSGTVTLTGTLRARGGHGAVTGFAGGGGSGGAIRVIATTVTGSGGTIDVLGGQGFGGAGSGSAGRVRIESYTNTAQVNFGTVPGTAVTVAQPTVVALTNGPVLSITSVAGVAAPSAPGGSLGSPDIVLSATTTNPVAVALAASNIPAGTNVTVAVAGQVGGTTATVATLSGTTASSTASANVTIPTTQPCLITASATFPLSSQGPGGPTFVHGEEVEWVRVTARLGGASDIAYVTKSGRIVEASATP